MHNFTPVSALIGGVLIGLSASLLFLLNGRIAGISGIFLKLFPPIRHDFLWRLMFLIGLIAGTYIYYFLPEIHFSYRLHYPVYLLILAGLLVGIGTSLSGGCTSGHGVCGIARFSPRSFVATLTFILFGMLTTYIVRHIWGIS